MSYLFKCFPIPITPFTESTVEEAALQWRGFLEERAWRVRQNGEQLGDGKIKNGAFWAAFDERIWGFLGSAI